MGRRNLVNKPCKAKHGRLASAAGVQKTHSAKVGVSQECCNHSHLCVLDWMFSVLVNSRIPHAYDIYYAASVYYNKTSSRERVICRYYWAAACLLVSAKYEEDDFDLYITLEALCVIMPIQRASQKKLERAERCVLAELGYLLSIPTTVVQVLRKSMQRADRAWPSKSEHYMALYLSLIETLRCSGIVTVRTRDQYKDLYINPYTHTHMYKHFAPFIDNIN